MSVTDERTKAELFHEREIVKVEADAHLARMGADDWPWGVMYLERTGGEMACAACRRLRELDDALGIVRPI